MAMDFARTRTLSTVTSVIRDHAPISRSVIVAETALTHAAVSRAVSELLDQGIVVEKRYADTAGPRRKHGLQLNGDHCYALGIEYTRTALRGVALDFANTRRMEKERSMDLAGHSRKDRIQAITRFCASLLGAARKAVPGRCVGLGIVDPGIVDRERGATIRSSLLDDWRDVPVADIVTERLGLPVRLLNSGTARLKAVDRLELRTPSRNLVFVEYGEGIACGLKLENMYIAGSTNLAGELGHMKTSSKPKPCRCGGMGCLEAEAALPAIALRCQEAIAAGSRSELSHTPIVDGRDVLRAAANQDALACRAVKTAFEHLGAAIAAVVSLSNPQVLVLDRMLRLAGERMCDHLVTLIRKSVLPDQWKTLEVRFSDFDSFIGPVGGAVDLVDSLLKH